MNKTLTRSILAGFIVGAILVGGPLVFGFLDEIFQNILPIDIFEFIAIPIFLLDSFVLLPFHLLGLGVCTRLEIACEPSNLGSFLLFILPVIINSLIFSVRDFIKAIKNTK